MSTKNKVTAPIARSTAYDFNCHLSTTHKNGAPRSALSENEYFGSITSYGEEQNVMPYEILFRDTLSEGTSGFRIKAMSSLNGVQINDATNPNFKEQYLACRTAQPSARKANQNLRDINQALNTRFQYVGIAITGCQAGPQAGALQRQGFAATRGGLMTIVNTGKDTIKAGETVKMHFDVLDILNRRRNDTNRAGVSYTKICPQLVAVRDTTNAAKVDPTTSEEGPRVLLPSTVSQEEFAPIIRRIIVPGADEEGKSDEE